MALSATLALRDAVLRDPARAQIELTVRNDGDADVRLPVALLAAPLVFELQDEAGHAVALGPPPVPPEDPAGSLRTIAPGQAVSLTYGWHELMADRPAPGRYRLRARAQVPDLGPGIWSGALATEWTGLESAPG